MLITHNQFLDLLPNNPQHYAATLVSHEGSRNIAVDFQKRTQQDGNQRPPEEPFSELSVTVKLNDKLLAYHGYIPPKDFTISNDLITIDTDWRKIDLSDGQALNFININGKQYYLANIVFKVSGEASSLTLKKLVFWKTGFTPPVFKQKYSLTFE